MAYELRVYDLRNPGYSANYHIRTHQELSLSHISLSSSPSVSLTEALITMGEYLRISVHRALGGGAVADVLLWRRWFGGVVLIVASTSLWLLFERAGYNIVSFASNVLLLLVVILFFWAKSASLLNRPLPPLPDLEISEESVLIAADVTRVWINRVLLVAHDIAVGRNLKLLLQVGFGLWIISYIGSFLNLLTLVYIGVLFSLSVPVLYEKYQVQVDEKLIVAHKIIQMQYQKLDDNVLRKIPMPLGKEKKTQ